VPAGVQSSPEPVAAFAERLRAQPGKNVWMMGGGDVWCRAASGAQLKGTAWLIPGRRTVRKVEAQKQRDAPPQP
jgi:hypothetical protein